MRLPGMRRARARPRRPRGHPALLMVADQGPPIATHPPHTSASASTPALVRLRKACCCCCSAALLLPLAVASAAAAVVLLLRLLRLLLLLTAPPTRAGVPAVPDLRRQGHQVQPKRPDARRDRLQEALQPVSKRAAARRHRAAASTMLRQVPEHGARTCARRVWRLWAARHSHGEADPVSRQPPPESPIPLAAAYYPGTRRADTTARRTTLERARRPGPLAALAPHGLTSTCGVWL